MKEVYQKVKNNKECVLENKLCTECGNCDMCDINPKKVCNNCCKCIDTESDFKGVYIDEIVEDAEVDFDIEDEDETENEEWRFNEKVIKEYD